jgi:uncharacterized phage protein (TIGR01671 family)
MNRDIKFRFWCPAGKSFVDDYKYSGLVDELFDTNEYDILLPQQYTGLKDKNEKEIYEGDIVRFGHAYDMMFLGQVVWNKEKAGFVINTPLKKEEHLHNYSKENLEVVGTIVESSELLNS